MEFMVIMYMNNYKINKITTKAIVIYIYIF